MPRQSRVWDSRLQGCREFFWALAMYRDLGFRGGLGFRVYILLRLWQDLMKAEHHRKIGSYSFLESRILFAYSS